MSDVRMLTIDEAAGRGRISSHMVRKLIKRGVLPAIRFSPRNLRVPSDALDRFIDTHRESQDPRAVLAGRQRTEAARAALAARAAARRRAG